MDDGVPSYRSKVTKVEGYDLSEHMYPSLAHALGGKIRGMSNRHAMGLYDGYFRKYPMRWRPDLTMDENFPEASIMHPVKQFDNPIQTVSSNEKTKD
jgi:hypothetical protein